MSVDDYKRTYPLPFGISVTFCFSGGSELRTEWKPDVPYKVVRSPRALRSKVEPAYVKARRDFFTDVATMFGGTVLIIDTEGGEPTEFEAVQPEKRQ
ncbi:hypothetical protein ACC806_34555 [Rhizobium ruizarguesonis]